jgi:BirA family biotin operon repressor/biotin-[acetyl-CoA-carboxylase] ligase
MEKDLKLKIRYLDSIASTQESLKELIKKKRVSPPYAIVANIQNAGVGSRENSWIGLKGNLFLSFALSVDKLPKDLKIESASIYFAYLLKEVFFEYGSKVWLKWPNDFYLKDKKIGGMITTVVDNVFICGVGVNLENNPQKFTKLDIEIPRDLILKKYIENIEKDLTWKQVFSKYKLEFYKNKKFSTHNNSSKISLENVTLNEDGSILNNGERIYSLR